MRKILNKTDINLVLSMASIFVPFVIFLSYGMKSTGVYYDDDIGHYMIARFSWGRPEVFFNTWGRPAFTLLYAPIALFGFNAVRVFSAILASVTCLGSIYLARHYNVRWYWLAAIFTSFQPEFLRQSFSSLTELSFAFIFCIALIAYTKQNWTVMAIAVGWLPLARYESLPIVLVFIFILIKQRKYHLLFWVVGPLLVQNSFWAIKEQRLSFLLFPFDQVFGLKHRPGYFDYGIGDALYYIRLLPVAYGWIGLVTLCYGALKEKFGILHLCTLLAIGTLSITYWLLPSAGVAGYIRHLSVISPAVGVLSAIGLEKFTESFIAIFPVFSRHNRRAVVTVLLTLGILMGLVVPSLNRVQPFYLNEEQQIVIQAANWFKNSIYNDRLVLGSHVYFLYTADLDNFDRNVFLRITPDNVQQAPEGSIIVWDSHYSHRLSWSTPREILQDKTRFRLLQTWEKGNFEISIYEKLMQ